MQREKLAPLLLASFAGLLVIIALAIVGGPGQGRAEKLDRHRLQDLRVIERLINCQAREADGVLPETFEPSPTCESSRDLTDPKTGAAYRYEKLSDTQFQLCADFERPVAQQFEEWERRNMVPDTGCYTAQVNQNAP